MKELPQLITRSALAIGFLMPVADRLGFMGLPGSGVSWGDWSHFLGYTRIVMAFVPEGMINILGLFATALEVWFGISLLVGFKIKINAIGSALLCLIFGFSMIISIGLVAPFKYPVFVFAGASLLLSQVKDPKWSLDELTA